MSITRGVLVQSSEPEAHDKVLDNNPDGIGREESRTTRRKTSRSKEKNQQQTRSTYDAKSSDRTWATLVGGLGGRRVLSLLRHSCSPVKLLPIFQKT